MQFAAYIISNGQLHFHLKRHITYWHPELKNPLLKGKYQHQEAFCYQTPLLYYQKMMKQSNVDME